MMNAEENIDTDIDVNLNDDDNCSGEDEDVPLAPSVPKESPVPPPITPMYTQSLLNDDGARNTDDDMRVYDSLSSDSSVSEPTVKRTPYGKKNAAGLFKTDQTKDIFASVGSKAKIIDKVTHGEQMSTPVPELIPPSASGEPVSTPVQNLTTTNVVGVGSNSAAKCLFPDDKGNDDFLKTTDMMSTTSSGLKSSSLTNIMNECSIYDKTNNNTSQTLNYTSPIFPSPIYGENAEFLSGAQAISPPASGNTISPFAFQQGEVELQKTKSDGFISETFGAANNSPNPLNTSHYLNGSAGLMADAQNNPISYFNNGQTNQLVSKSSDINTDIRQSAAVCGQPALYNPSTFSSPNVVQSNSQNHATEVHNISEPSAFFNSSQNGMQSSGGNLQFTNTAATSKESTAVQQKDDSPLFIPQMYNTTPSIASSYFVPQEVNNTSSQNNISPHVYPPSLNGPTPSSHAFPSSTSPLAHSSLPPSYASPTRLDSSLSNFNSPPCHANNTASPPSYGPSPPTYDHCMLPDNYSYDISPLGHKEGQKGIFAWLKGTVTKDWSTGADKFKQYVKTATDSVLTTLDPGMKDYLNPAFRIHTSSQPGQSVPMMVGLKEGLRCALHCEPMIEEHVMSSGANILLPIGFDGALQAIFEQLEYLKGVLPDSSWDHICMASKLFLTELVSGKWFVMYCVGIEDQSKDILLHAFSQPIPLPIGCITSAYNNALHNERGECVGYSKTMDDIVRAFVHPEKDWCLALSGTPLQQIIATTVQCLALDYQRHVVAKNNIPQQMGNNYQTYSNNTNTNNGIQSQSNYALSIDAIT